MSDEKVILPAHGGGGLMMRELLEQVVLPRLGNPLLERLEDAAVLAATTERLAFTTDAFVVKPLFFRGGDIGRLAVCGTVNDLAAMGARPLALSLAMILEEGLPISTVERVLDSAASTAKEANVRVVAGDTKVVERGAADGLYLTTAGIGAVPEGARLGTDQVRPGDAILVTGSLGEHGIAIISERSGLAFETPVRSDVAPLSGLVANLMSAHAAQVHCMRDPTRGGTAAVLNEIAEAARVKMEIDESSIPVLPAVSAACDMLGFDPLYVPNEGRMVIFCEGPAADSILSELHKHALGTGAARIGRVVEGEAGRVILKTRVGGSRILTLPYGEQLPRIC